MNEKEFIQRLKTMFSIPENISLTETLNILGYMARHLNCVAEYQDFLDRSEDSSDPHDAEYEDFHNRQIDKLCR